MRLIDLPRQPDVKPPCKLGLAFGRGPFFDTAPAIGVSSCPMETVLPPDLYGQRVKPATMVPTPALTRAQSTKAEIIFKSLVKQGFNVPELANIFGHMGAMLVEWADKLGERELEARAEQRRKGNYE